VNVHDLGIVSRIKEDAMIAAEWIGGLFGGALIGLATCCLLLFLGRLSGISGIVDGLFDGANGQNGWRWSFVWGLLAGGLLGFVVAPQAFANTTGTSIWTMAVAGLLVGYGTRLGSGCTGGHGVCGLPRLAPRSIVATLTFIATGAVTVAFMRAISG
jgi:uncharacterized membrane protein YedE/YeeE